jgi:tetratricopeptide (TPR) repeat protein
MLAPGFAAAANLMAVTPSVDPAEYVNLLRNERTRLEKIGAADIPASVEASIGVSYDLLSAEGQRVFRQLAVFPGSFDGAAEANVCEDEGGRRLGELVRRSLVQYDENTKRHKLHDLVRLFADGPLSVAERAVAERRHAFHYKGVLAEAGDRYEKGGESVLKALRMFDAEWVHIQAGQAWAARHAEGDREAASLCSDYPWTGAYLVELRQHPQEQIRWREAGLRSARGLGDRPAQVRHLGNLGNACYSLGEYRRAINYHEQSMAIAREIADRRREGQCLCNLGSAYYSLGECWRAIEYYEQAMDIAREIEDRRGEGQCVGNLGATHHSLGDYRRAIDYHDQNLTIAREIGDRLGESAALCNLGIAYGALGEYRRAIQYQEQSLASAHEIGDRNGEGTALYNLALANEQLERYAEALESAEAALRVFDEIEDPSVPIARELLERLRARLIQK